MSFSFKYYFYVHTTKNLCAEECDAATPGTESKNKVCLCNMWYGSTHIFQKSNHKNSAETKEEQLEGPTNLTNIHCIY